MSVYLAGLGTAVPQHRVEQADAAEQSAATCATTPGERRLATAVYRRAGVDTRHSVVLQASTNGEPARQEFFLPPDTGRPLGPTTAQRMMAYGAAASGLALDAARGALADARLDPQRVTHVVTVSCSGFGAPGVDVALIAGLGLRPGVSRTHVGFMGCHGALNGLRVARAYVEADPAAVVLLVAVELCSLHFHYRFTPEHVVANSLFADGAAAVALTSAASEGTRRWRLADNWSEVFPDTLDAMSWSIGDHGFEMTLSQDVPDLIRAGLRPRIDAWLHRRGLSVERVGCWAVHPGGPRIVDACRDALGLSEASLEASRGVLRSYGNMSSPTVLFVLDRLTRASSSGPCVLLGFGPGLAAEAALCE